MKSAWSTPLCAVALVGALVVGCNNENEEIVPDMKKQAPAATEKAPAPAAEQSDEPELVPIQSLSQGTKAEAPAAEKAEKAPAPAATGDIQPQSEGPFVIQVSIQPSKKGADGIVKKRQRFEKPSEEKKRIETAARRKRLKEIADQNRKRLY